MKLPFWLGLSIAANVVLVAALFVLIAASRPHASTSIAAGKASSPAVREPAAPPPKPNPAATEVPAWVQAMRAAGVPDDVVSATVAADFDRRWWRQHRELQRRFERGEIDGDSLADHSNQHDREQEVAMLATLGEADFRRWHQHKLLDEFDRAAIALSPAEADAIYQWRQRLNRNVRQLEDARREGLLDEAEFMEYALGSQATYERQLRMLLGDARLAALHPVDADAPTDAALRRALREARIAPERTAAVLETHREIDALRAELARRLSAGQIEPALYDRQARELELRRDETLLRLLGPEAAAELRKAQDARYLTLKRFAGAWELKPGELEAVYETLSAYDQRLREHQPQSTGLPPDQVDARREQLRQETEEKLRAYLGDARFQRMKKTDVLAAQE